MKKQKTKFLILALMAIFAGGVFADKAQANGSATVSWTAPTLNEGGGELTDLAGYRIFYSTSAIDCTAWDAASNNVARIAAFASIDYVDVTEASTLRDTAVALKRGYTFSTGNLLTPGQPYFFTVVAYDNASSPNYSKCVNDGGANKTASKTIYHSGNLKDSGTINSTDLSILAGDFGKGIGGINPWCRIAGHPSDISGDCIVNSTDLSIFAGEFGL